VAKPTPKPTPKPPTQVAKLEPSPLPPVEPAPVEPLPRAPTMPLAAPPAPTPGQTALMAGEQPGTAPSGTTSGPAGGNRGIGSGTEGRGPGLFGSGRGPGDDYLERLRRWLAKHKKYPPESVKRKEEGNVMVGFVLARDGTVLSAQIERSSGFPLIDQAVLDMLRRASPVPPVPAHYNGERLTISMPVNFSLGFFERLF
jgi:protein TonB